MSHTPLMAAFLEQVERTDSCWLWTGKNVGFGYGFVPKALRATPNAGPRAHRNSWIFHFGEIPKGLVVCRRCDNPPCIRPEHLFLGTPGDNMSDAWAKGRIIGRPRKDSAAPLARWLEAHRRSVKTLADKAGVSPARIYSVAAGNVPKADIAVRISEATGGGVTVEEIAFPKGRGSQK